MSLDNNFSSSKTLIKVLEMYMIATFRVKGILNA